MRRKKRTAAGGYDATYFQSEIIRGHRLRRRLVMGDGNALRIFVMVGGMDSVLDLFAGVPDIRGIDAFTAEQANQYVAHVTNQDAVRPFVGPQSNLRIIEPPNRVLAPELSASQDVRLWHIDSAIALESRLTVYKENHSLRIALLDCEPHAYPQSAIQKALMMDVDAILVGGVRQAIHRDNPLYSGLMTCAETGHAVVLLIPQSQPECVWRHDDYVAWVTKRLSGS